tara:strand:- start:3212 stop:4468 length:1257 start_codon:yes stop_codon:yes gene_type:complete
MKISIQNQMRIALLYFLIAASLGLLLRLWHVFDIDVNYKFVKHGHSHIALLGWVYLCLTTVFYALFVKQNTKIQSRYSWGFIVTQVTLVGMLVTFPVQGYAFLSITFSTLFLFASYWFTWFFLKNVKPEIKALVCFPYIKASLYYLVVSSIGPWVLGGIMATLGPTSVWYRLAIYFYLHFQYNGWMLLAVIGIILFFMERGGITLSRKRAEDVHDQRESAALKRKRNIFIIINLSVVLTTLLSALWTEPIKLVYGLSALGGLLQLACFVYALIWLKKNKNVLKSLFSSLQWFLFKTVIVVLSVKLLLQFFGSLPYFANLSTNIIELTIAYLHWVFLGVISLSLLMILNASNLMKLNRRHLYFYLIGFLMTEGLLIYKGIAIWSKAFTVSEYYNEYLLVASGLLFVAVALLILRKTKVI